MTWAVEDRVNREDIRKECPGRMTYLLTKQEKVTVRAHTVKLKYNRSYTLYSCMVLWLNWNK
jgi:hypothetical protein